MLGNGDATLLCSPRVLCAASDTLIATRKAGIGDKEEGSGHRQRNRRVLALPPPPAWRGCVAPAASRNPFAVLQGLYLVEHDPNPCLLILVQRRRQQQALLPAAPAAVMLPSRLLQSSLPPPGRLRP